ncbi:MAG: phage major capsid protein [Sediminimonas qiaohouensis]|uniref:Phage major capsid protein n=1 Tax=Sediminimonas qiaohouensis TaxID=552061 RepID=A0A7C9HNB8_9RHOB|nr:phage major capsid protein [Sediminimonas qiaohouensis]MTJ04963.1 phage major capsid protein [Sediminimonas qiaohouensis]
MKHERTTRGILAVRANAAGDPKQILSEMQSAFGEFKSAHQSQVRELQTGLDEVNQTLAGLRVGGAGPESGGVSQRDKTEVNSALRALIRNGDEAPLASLQSGVNAGMSTDSNPDGGFSVVPYLSPVMTERLHAISPMRQLARTEVIATDVFEEIADTGEAGAEWVTEREARGDTASPPLRPANWASGAKPPEARRLDRVARCLPAPGAVSAVVGTGAGFLASRRNADGHAPMPEVVARSPRNRAQRCAAPRRG